ncbi:division/cell wall cluster transcriptional repressor MraZ [Qipengyuania sp. DSG2-2]|uniref:division/cell wall cluster transcriptional repressor MraZ n=1 Tax=Qipengyuania sp. DGS2-2 TaxID=3349631 RepID=UPI0036D34C5A
MESEFQGYSGTAFSPAGDKGRFSLPPAFRKEVRAASGDNRLLCIDKHDRWNCLIGFGTSRRAELKSNLKREKKLAEKRGHDFDYDERSSELFGFETIPFDDSGRFVMPSHLGELANITGGLFFRGADDFFTMWDPEELYKMGPSWRAAQASCKNMVEQAQAKLAGKGGAK